MTPDAFRALALKIPGAAEAGHMGHPDFRVGGKIFATLGYPDAGWAMVKLTPDQQEAFVSAEPEVFVPVKGAWGRGGATNVRLRPARAKSVRVALSAACRNVAPVPPAAASFATPAALRAWLGKNHASTPELILRCYKRDHARLGVTYRQALDEALCFGWIDGVRHALDAKSFTVRFTPRKAVSAWSRVNLKRAAELEAAGRMRPPGLAALRRGKTPSYSYESRPQVLGEAFLARLRSKAGAWRFFRSQPDGYRRTAAFWVMSAKRPETREARFSVLLASSADGLRIPLLRR